MQSLTYFVAVSLDGYIARPDGSFDAFVDDPACTGDFFEAIKRYSVVVMGRRTYQVGLDAGVTSPYPFLQQVVVSRSEPPGEIGPVHWVSRDAIEHIRQLKQQPGEGVWLCGGGSLAGQLLRAGLIDRVKLKLNPIALGRGIALFGDEPLDGKLSLQSSRSYPSGIVLLDYRIEASAPAQ